MPEQRAFSPQEVATMLGVRPATVSSLLAGGELGSKKIGDAHRIFLSDLEDYLGEERARSLVCEVNSDEQEVVGDTSQEKDAPENSVSEKEEKDETNSSEAGIGADLEMEIKSREEAQRELGASGRRRRTSRYEPVAQKWSESSDDESIVLSDLEKNDVQDLCTLMYRRFDKETVIVRAAEQEDGIFKAVIRAREGSEYLRD
jgi:excisionase family DNA binding protein